MSMTHDIRLVLALAGCILLLGCGDSLGPRDGPITTLPRDLSVAEAKLIEADNAFALKLFREINAQEGDKNVFVSPLSVAMALGMTYNGSAGSTRDAMQQALELRGMSIQEVNQSYRDLIDLLRNLDHRVEFQIANSIWHRNTMTFEPAFLDLNREFFDAEVSAIDFGANTAAGTINGWVSEKTNGKIERIVPDPIPANTVMYLINAIYFKADWTYQFDKSRTHGAPFTLDDGSQVTADMMSHDGEIPVQLRWSDDLLIVELPYGGEAYQMTVLLPYGQSSIADLLESLTAETWSGWIDELAPSEIGVSLPKFTLEYELVMNDVLTALGMGEAFTPTADFTNMFAPGGIWIDEVRHKSFVQVDEEGTEAAAVTSVSMTDSAPLSIVVDRPFAFVLRERLSGTILFIGKVMDPTAE
jgi:serpin B